MVCGLAGLSAVCEHAPVGERRRCVLCGVLVVSGVPAQSGRFSAMSFGGSVAMIHVQCTVVWVTVTEKPPASLRVPVLSYLSVWSAVSTQYGQSSMNVERTVT